MQRNLARELPNCVDKHVVVRGWLNNLRSMGKLAFLLLRDRTGLAQIVIEDPAELQKVSHLQPGSILTIHGRVVASNAIYRAEIVDPKIVLENPIHEVSPIEYYKPEIHTDLEFILDHRPIALRNRQLNEASWHYIAFRKADHAGARTCIRRVHENRRKIL